MNPIVCLWRSEDSLMKSFLFFYLFIGFRDQTQVLCNKLLYPLNQPLPASICFLHDVCSSIQCGAWHIACILEIIYTVIKCATG